MKYSDIYLCFITLILGGIIISCENMNKTQDWDKDLQSKNPISMEVPAPLNSIPQWVKEKVNSDTYEKLKIISTRYHIEYSFLREDITQKRWQKIDRSMDELIEEIEAGKIPENSHWIWTVTPERSVSSFLKLERLSLEEYDENEEPRSQNIIIYSAISLTDVYVGVVITYTYNRATEAASGISVSVYAESEIPSREPNFNGNCIADYSPSTKSILGSCSGTLSYNDSEHHRTNEVLQNVQFRITP